MSKSHNMVRLCDTFGKEICTIDNEDYVIYKPNGSKIHCTANTLQMEIEKLEKLHCKDDLEAQSTSMRLLRYAAALLFILGLLASLDIL